MTQQQAAALPTYAGGDLGAYCQPSGTTFKLWAPTATAATLHIFATGTDEEPGAQELFRTAMARIWAGVWTVTVPDDLSDAYYVYHLTFADGRTVVTADPYANACGANGARSMVIDLKAAELEGWRQDRRPYLPARTHAVWEVHVGDFTADPHSGVPAPWRGKYLGFTLPDTTLDGAGQFPTCLNYLKRLGISHIQLQPIFDFACCDETRPGAYNWGYDPLNYRIPEGSYATDPFHGAARVRECRAMVQAIHRAGLGAVMDVVFNHTVTPDSWLERTVPGYYNRRTPEGKLTDGSACGCDLASERLMYRKYMVDCCVHWAEQYHIDGFRFDLMALHDIDTMNAIRAALDALPGGQDILLYGEPWQGGSTNFEGGARPADKRALDVLNDRIGFFCDNTRDDIKGSAFHAGEPGYVNGGPYHGVRLLHALDAWRDGSAGYTPRAAQQVIQYVSAHDNFTLWDKLKATARRTDWDAPDETVLAQNRMAAGIYLTCRGLAFMQAGEEFARTKGGDGNSYRGPQTVNQLDWRRAARFAALTEYYRGLLAIRKSHPALSGADGRPDLCLLAMQGWVIGFVVEEEGGDGRLAVFYNPEPAVLTVELPAGRWMVLCDGTRAATRPIAGPVQKKIPLAPYSVTILSAENDG